MTYVSHAADRRDWCSCVDSILRDDVSLVTGHGHRRLAAVHVAGSELLSSIHITTSNSRPDNIMTVKLLTAYRQSSILFAEKHLHFLWKLQLQIFTKFHHLLYCISQATGYASQHIWCLSQARINWESHGRKGIRRKNVRWGTWITD